MAASFSGKFVLIFLHCENTSRPSVNGKIILKSIGCNWFFANKSNEKKEGNADDFRI